MKHILQAFLRGCDDVFEILVILTNLNKVDEVSIWKLVYGYLFSLFYTVWKYIIIFNSIIQDVYRGNTLKYKGIQYSYNMIIDKRWALVVSAYNINGRNN